MFFKKPADTGECFYKDLRHFLALQICRRQNKGRHTCLHECQPLHMSISDAMVLGQDNPAALCCLGEPVFVFGIRGEVVVVDVENSTGLAERGSTRFFPRERSRKKTGSSGGFDGEFAPDGFFDFEPPASIIVCQVVHGFAGLVAFRDHGCRNACANQH